MDPEIVCKALHMYVGMYILYIVSSFRFLICMDFYVSLHTWHLFYSAYLPMAVSKWISNCPGGGSNSRISADKVTTATHSQGNFQPIFVVILKAQT
jgi:hypothetical protein